MMELRYTRHALSRMFERSIEPSEVESAILNGTVVEDYPSDMPYPSRLILFRSEHGPLHVVYSEAVDRDTTIRYIITVYRPDPLGWDESLTKRKERL
jgi:hypothetical protein